MNTYLDDLVAYRKKKTRLFKWKVTVRPLGLQAGKKPRFGSLPVVNQSGVHYRSAKELDLCSDSVPTLFTLPRLG